MENDNPYINIFSDFARQRIKYLIVGGYAAILYGANRMTKDMDIVIDLEIKNLKRCLDILEKNNFSLSHQYIKKNEVTAENIIKWKKEKNMKALRFENKLQPFLFIDIILEFPKDFNLLYKNRVKNKLNFISKEDLIEMKAQAGRIQDFQDNFSLSGETIWLEKLKEKFSNEKK